MTTTLFGDDGMPNRTWRFNSTALVRNRERQLLTQEAVHIRSGVAWTTVSRLERGMHTPRFTTVKKLADALQSDPGELVEWIDDDDTLPSSYTLQQGALR